MEFEDYLKLFTPRRPFDKKIGLSTYAHCSPERTWVRISFGGRTLVHIEQDGRFMATTQRDTSPTVTKRLNHWLPYNCRFEPRYGAAKVRVLVSPKTGEYPWKDGAYWSKDFLRDDFPEGMKGISFTTFTNETSAFAVRFLRTLMKGEMHLPDPKGPLHGEGPLDCRICQDGEPTTEHVVMHVKKQWLAPSLISHVTFTADAAQAVNNAFSENRVKWHHRLSRENYVRHIEAKLCDPNYVPYHPRRWHASIRHVFERWLLRKSGYVFDE